MSEATCTQDGSRKHVCSICGAERTEAIPAFGHSWNEGGATTEPTTEKEGVKTFICGTCGATKTEVVAKLKQENCGTSAGKAGDKGNLPVTGDPASVLGLVAAGGATLVAIGGATRRRK